jgi:hypothetical protein
MFQCIGPAIYMAIQQEHGEGGDREDVGSEVDDPLRELDVPPEQR